MPAMNRMKYFEPVSKEEGVRHFSWLLNSSYYKQILLSGCEYKVSLWFESNLCRDIAFLCPTLC